MEPSANTSIVDVAQAAFDDFSSGLIQGEWAPFLEHLTPDFSFWFPAGPFQGHNEGIETMTQFLTSVSRVFPEGLTLTVLNTLTNDNTVLFEVHSEGKMLGQPYENQAAIAFDVRGDKICAYREYLGVIFQLGE